MTPTLSEQLRGLGRALRLVASVRGLLWWLLGCGALLAALAVAAAAHAPAWTLPLAALLGGLGLPVALLRPLTMDLRRRRVAAVIEQQYPDLRELVLSAAELSEPRGPLPFSSTLTAAVVAEAEAAVAALPRAPLLQTRRLRPLALLAAVALLCGVSLAVLCRASLADMLQVTRQLPAVAQAVQRVLPPAATPLLSGVQLEVAPLPYTALPPRVLTENLRQVRVPAGSRVTISVRRPANGTVSLQVGKSACKLRQLANDRSGFSFTPRVGGAWRLAAGDGSRRDVRSGFIEVLTDQRPTVRITYPRRDLTLEESRPVKLAAMAVDDYGLTQLALEYLVSGTRRWQRLELGASGHVQRVEYEWDLAPLNLAPGQSVSYRFYVRDNNVFTGPGEARSDTYQVVLADHRPREARQRLQQAQQKQSEELQRLRQQAAEVQQQLAELQEQVQQGERRELTAEQRAQLQQAAAQLEKQAETLRQALAQAQQEVRQAGPVAPELARKMEELSRLLNETLDKQLAEAIRKLQQAAQGQQPEQAPQALQQAAEAQQELVQRLDQMLALLQQARLEGALAALREEVEKLAARQQELIGQRQEQTDLPRQARDQKLLGRDSAGLPEKLERLAQEAAQSAAQTAGRLEQIAARLHQADPAGQMQRAAGSLRAGQPREAAAPQQQALQALQQAAADLAGAEADVYSERREELQRVSAELVHSALYLSRQQEALQEQTAPYQDRLPEQLLRSKATLQELARRQQAIGAGAAHIAERLAALAAKSPLVEPGLLQQAAGIVALSAQAQRDLDGGAMQAAGGEEEAVTAALNQLAEKLLQSDQQFQQASAQMALQEYLKRLEQLAQQQRGVNQRTQQQGGGSPQPQPGGQQPGGQGAGGLADQQAAIRQALQQMLGQAGNQGGLGDQLGGLPAQMDDVEKDLRGQQVTRQTYRRQGDILHKMLDAQRSLYQKDREERQRKAEAPRPYKRPASPPALRKTALTPRQPLGAPAQPELPLGYEDLTKAYLQALTRSGGR